MSFPILKWYEDETDGAGIGGKERMKINLEVPSVMDMLCETTPKELNKLQVEELERFEKAIKNMRKKQYEPAFKGCYDEFDKEWCLEEGIARTMITIVQLMVIHRIDIRFIQERINQIFKYGRWGNDDNEGWIPRVEMV